MIVLNFFKPVLDALDDGKIIRLVISFILQFFGVLSLIGGVYILVEILKVSFELPTEGTIGGLILSIIFIAAVLAVVQIYFYRAKNIRDLGESQFTVIPIFSILLRCLGEVYATIGVAIGVGGCIFIWLSGSEIEELFELLGKFFPLPPFEAEATFLGGLIFLVYSALLSFVVILLFYFLAESTIVLVDIAKNIRYLLQKGSES